MIKVGLTERHGISDEYAKSPPQGVEYQFVTPQKKSSSFGISSTAKGVLDFFDDPAIDIFEAPLFPILARQSWIYTPAEYAGSANFGALGLPIPRGIRLKLLEKYFARPNLKAILFKSEAGLETLSSYGHCSSELIQEKSRVVYPVMNTRRTESAPFSGRNNILFSGDFFRKGGASVVEAFEMLQPTFPDLRLRLCCDERLDNEGHPWTRSYLDRITNNSSITIGKVPRKEMLSSVLPNTGIFVSPTLRETFGFAILEAMSFGIPVVATDIFAIPEIISNGVDGMLVSVNDLEYVRDLKGYSVGAIPSEVFNTINSQVYERLLTLLTVQETYEKVSNAALEKCRNRFSPTARAQVMKPIYQGALNGS